MRMRGSPSYGQQHNIDRVGGAPNLGAGLVQIIPPAAEKREDSYIIGTCRSWHQPDGCVQCCVQHAGCGIPYCYL